MLSNGFRSKRCLLLLSAVIAISAIAGAQEPGTRTPGSILPPEHAGILLMESREQMEQPEKILQVMALRDGDIVADIGCGNGFYTLRLAKKVGPHGLIFAVDVQQGMLDQLVKRQKEADISNIYPVLGKYDDPLLPPGKIDWILLVDAYHEFSNPAAMLARMKECLAPGGRVALIEYRYDPNPGRNRFPMPRDHSMTEEEVMNEWIPAGFERVALLEFLPMQHFFIFKSADDTSRPVIRRMDIENMKYVSTFDNRVYFAGQPDEAALKQFTEFGVKVVINLKTAQEMAAVGFDEKKAVEEEGMKYIHAPMGFEIPGATTMQEILSALDNSDKAPVLLHCETANRAGVIWALYACRKGNVSIDQAVAEGKAAGISIPFLEQAVRKELSK